MYLKACIIGVFIAISGAGCYAQTLRVRCNSADNLQVVAVGADNKGHYASQTLYDMTQDNWRTVSLYDVKFGYDKYNNSEMVHGAADSTWRWKKILVYNNNVLFDSLDITKPAKHVTLGTADIWAKVKIAYERDYVITDVILNDE